MDSPAEIMVDLEKIQSGWENIAPDDELNEIKLVDYKTQTEKSRDVRRRIKANELENKALLNERDDTDKDSIKMRNEVVDGARLSRRHGRNSTLYESFGYKRESEYESGLTHKHKDDGDGDGSK
jgi:hypothetical protein